MATQLPDDFKCPISLEIMSDPVILSSGHTFDRSSIQRWLDSGHRTCPVTKIPLPEHPALIPNHALRSLISSFALLSPSKSQSYHPRKYHDFSLIQALNAAISSPSSSLSAKLDSLSQLAKLTKLDPALRRQLTESGAVPAAVLRCVNSPEPAIQQKSLSLLLNLSLDDDAKVGLVAEGAIDRVVGVLRAGFPDIRAISCTILTSLAVVEVNKATIGSYPGAIRAMVGLIEEGRGREVKEAATALYAICSFPDNRQRAVECGAVPVLVRRVEMGMERAAEVLSLLVKCKEGREEMGKVNGCVGALVTVVRNGSERGVQCALFALDCLCCYSDEMRSEAKKEGALEACVGLVEDENEKIRSKAVSLVKMLTGRRRR